MKKSKKYILSLSTFLLFYANIAKAVCPVCTVSICLGVGLSRWCGVDDVITGLWVGGLIVSSIMWSLDWLKRKNINFTMKKFVVSLLFYGIVLSALYWKKFIGIPHNTFCCIDKLIFGIFAGTLVFLVGVKVNNLLKKKNNGSVFFSFQKVVIPISFLVFSSGILYFLVKLTN